MPENGRSVRRFSSALTFAFLVSRSVAQAAATPAPAPNLALAAAIVAAGGGAAHFSSAALVADLAGDRMAPEIAKLDARYGDTAVANALSVFDFAIGDAVTRATAGGAALPSPDPAPTDTPSLRRALVVAGTAGDGSWDVGALMDRLVSPAVSKDVTHDIDAKFGAPSDARYHEIVDRLFDDLAAPRASRPPSPGPSAAASPAPETPHAAETSRPGGG